MARLSSTTSAATRTQVKAERVVKQEKSEKAKGKRKARIHDDDVDGEENNSAEGEYVHHVNGRATNGVVQNGHDNHDENEEENEDEDENERLSHGKRTRINQEGDAGRVQLQERIKTLPRDRDGYIPGSIVRIQLKNFVTYDFVEFSVGPYLNMILGPNGTGKSSIACAICLGLNFPPSILGRASELNSFVKNGTPDGHIEIELKGRKGHGNLVIRRMLSAASKSSSFSLNGKQCTHKEITAKVAELNVQISNLCSFLPQDKVSEFAQMTPQQLLKETQRAAGHERLTTWHDTLIDAGKELKVLDMNIREDHDQLHQMELRNEAIERDVQRFRERKSIEAMIALLEVLIQVERYRELRTRFLESKKKQRSLHEQVKKLKLKNEPAHELLKKLEIEHKEHDKIREEITKTTRAKFNKMSNKWAASDKLETEAEELSVKLDQLKKEEKERQRKIKGLEAEIEKTKQEQEKLAKVKLENPEDILADFKQINLERSAVKERKEDVEEKLKINIDNKARMNAQLEAAFNDLRKLDDLDNRKLQGLGRWDQDCHDAVLWLRNNRNLFKMEVFEPPILSVNVPDKRYATAVEGCINSTQLKTFVCQCQEDSDTMNRYINDNGALGRKARVATWFRPQLRSIPPPMSREELDMIGFDGYAIDYIDCPQGMRWYLQVEANLHRTAISLNPKIDVSRAMEFVARPETGGAANFISGTTLNTVSRSQYGRKAVGNTTRDLPPARNFVNVTIDPDVKRRIDEKIAQCQTEMVTIDKEREELDSELQATMEEDKRFQARTEDVNQRRASIQKVKDGRIKLAAKLSRNENSLATLRSKPSADVERVRLKRELLDITNKRIQIAKEYTALARSIIAEQFEATKKGIKYLQVGANRLALQALCDRKDEKYQTALAKFNQADKEFQTIKAASKAALEESRKMMNAIDAELRERYNAIENKRTQYEKELAEAEKNGTTPPSAEGVDLRTLGELQTELETQRANLELNLNTNPGVVEQYERRKRDIEELGQAIEQKQKKADKIERNIKTARDNWQPALEKLVASIGEKFSAAFDRIGCAGEIRISQHEDYEKWAIDILVKFRDTERLQLLTAQRQSGGERSLTTILYLLSLTEEARAPFSLVDEINQGMDARAERSVHNSIVDVTCKADSAQYFLITPKLLPDLVYHDRMKILCVNNGEWLPEERDLGNMMSMINGFLTAQNRQGHHGEM